MQEDIVATLPGFSDITIEQLEAAPPYWLDEASFGIIGMNADGLVDIYNTTESRLAGLSPARVVGWHFFDAVGICMNNYMVSQRFKDEPFLDQTISYVLTLRMRPTPVKLRLLKKPNIIRSYVLVQR